MPLWLYAPTTERDSSLSLSKASIYTYSLKLNFHTKVFQSLTKFSRIFSLSFLIPALSSIHSYNKSSLIFPRFSLRWHKLQPWNILRYSRSFREQQAVTRASLRRLNYRYENTLNQRRQQPLFCFFYCWNGVSKLQYRITQSADHGSIHRR